MIKEKISWLMTGQGRKMGASYKQETRVYSKLFVMEISRIAAIITKSSVLCLLFLSRMYKHFGSYDINQKGFSIKRIRQYFLTEVDVYESACKILARMLDGLHYVDLYLLNQEIALWGHKTFFVMIKTRSVHVFRVFFTYVKCLQIDAYVDPPLRFLNKSNKLPNRCVFSGFYAPMIFLSFSDEKSDLELCGFVVPCCNPMT